MKGYTANDEQAFYIDGVQLSGISSINMGYTIPSEKNTFLGYNGNIKNVQNGAGVGSLNFSRVMLSDDEPITSLFLSKSGFNGGIQYGSNELNFESGYIDSYECSFSVDQLPESNLSATIFGRMGNEIEAPLVKRQNPQKELFMPPNSGIFLHCDGVSTNRVTSFSFRVQFSNEPYYKIGDIYPCEVITQLPVDQSFTATIDVDDYQTKNVYDYIKKGIHTREIKIVLSGKCNQEKQVEYLFENAELLSESFSTDAENNTTVTLNYSCSSMKGVNIKYI